MIRRLENKLAGCLTAKGINQSQLARRFQLTRAHVSRLVAGKVRPSLELALRLGRYFQTPVEEIFQLAEEAPKPISRPRPAADRNH